MNLLNRIDFLPAFAARLKEEPDVVVSQFEIFRQGRKSAPPNLLRPPRLTLCISCSVTNPRAIRVQVKGNILGLEKPVSSWLEHFKAIQPFPVRALSAVARCVLVLTHLLLLQASELVPVKRSSDVMGPLGKQPAKKVHFPY